MSDCAKHLRGLKAFGFADDDIFHVGGNYRGRTSAIDVVVATSLECFHQCALAAVAERDDRHCGIFGVGTNHARDVERAHFAHFGGADDRRWRVIFESSEGEGGLGAAVDFKTFALQGITETFGKINVGVDQENLGGRAGDH